MVDRTKRTFWEILFIDILTILCAAAIPIALGIYTAITYKQDQEHVEQAQQFSINQAIELRQDTIYDKFLNNIYDLDKDGHLNEEKKPWAFANAYYRAAHRQLDPIRKGDVLQFLKEKQLIGRNNCSTGCNSKKLDDIIRLNELNFNDVYLKSQTGTLNRLNLECVSFDQVSMTNATFLFANLNGVSFDQGRLDNAKFGNSSLVCASFNGTDLDGIDFGTSNLSNAHFSNVDLSKVKLTEEQRNQARFSDVTGLNEAIKQTTTTKKSSTTKPMTTTTTTTKKEFLTTQQSSTVPITTPEKTTAKTITQVTSRLDTTVTTTTATITTTKTTITTATAITITRTKTTTTTATISTTIATDIVCSMTLITFDDISNQSSTTGVIPNGYKNLNWINAKYINASITPNNSDYRKAVRSSPFVMDNPTGGSIQFGTANGLPFSVSSFHLTTVLPDPHIIVFQLVIGATTQPILRQALSAVSTTMNCNGCANINSFIIQVDPGNSLNNLARNGTKFIIDDLCVSP